MRFKSVVEKIKRLFNGHVYRTDWRCLYCGKEIFDKRSFCDSCFEKLPFNDKVICNHCGRQVIAAENYCTTCKGRLVSIDRGRSYFVYDKPISTLVQRFKYGNQQFLSDYFAECLSKIYFKNYFNADFFVYVPMTDKAKRQRGYNQSELLARKLSEITEVPVLECLSKIKETKRQATLGRAERLKNLQEAFRVTDKKSVKGKIIVIVDDVTTTGATAEAIAARLKKAGAKSVNLITVASTSPPDKY